MMEKTGAGRATWMGLKDGLTGEVSAGLMRHFMLCQMLACTTRAVPPKRVQV